MLKSAPELVAYCGSHLDLIPWEVKFLRRLASTRGDMALSVARGNGKSALCAAVAAAVLDGPLRHPRAEVILVASSFGQAGIMGRDVVGFLGEQLNDRKVWRKRDTSGIFEIEHLPTRARLKALGSDPRRMHGIRPSLVLYDEPSQAPPSTCEAALAALRTSMGKHAAGSRLIALGTRPDSEDHWFARMLKEPGATVYACAPRGPAVSPAHLEAGEPVAGRLPLVGRPTEGGGEDRAEGPGCPGQLPGAPAQRGRVGHGGTALATSRHAWAGCRRETRPWSGSTSSGSTWGARPACPAPPGSGPIPDHCAPWPATATTPTRRSGGSATGAAACTHRCTTGASLCWRRGRISDVKVLLDEAWSRWGKPRAIVTDRWRCAELRKALHLLGWPVVALVERGMGYRDGSEDVRGFKAGVSPWLGHPRAFVVAVIGCCRGENGVGPGRELQACEGCARRAPFTGSGRCGGGRDLGGRCLGWRKALQADAPAGLRSAVV